MMKAYQAVETFVHGRNVYTQGTGPHLIHHDVGDALKAKGLLIDWVGKASDKTYDTVICIASGPSLTEDDCEAVREYCKRTGAGAIAVNLSFRRAPWANYLYGMDHDFWKQYGAEVKKTFEGVPVAPHLIPGTEYRNIVAGNSGAGAILLAAELGAKRIILIGYDCAYGDDGAAHWHADYPATMGNAGSVKKWPSQFKKVAQAVDAEIINASRSTALTLWQRVTLEECLS